MAMLDTENFVAESRDPTFLDRPAAERFGGSMMLPPMRWCA